MADKSPAVIFLCLLMLSAACSAQLRIAEDLKRMNSELSVVNAVTARLSWREAVRPGPEVLEEKMRLGEVYAEWRNRWCRKLLQDMKEAEPQPAAFFDERRGIEFRQYYLLCRGPKFDAEQSSCPNFRIEIGYGSLLNCRELTDILSRLHGIYHGSRICLKNETCIGGEPELERLMSTSRDAEVLLSAWLEWRNATGRQSKDLYVELVELLNVGARNNGYNDIGECWREELEVNDVEALFDELYEALKPLYVVLHAVVRYRLNRHYGYKIVEPKGMMPAHLLGNMWGQDWANLIDLIVDIPPDEDVNTNIKRKNYSVVDMVKRAEDFYVSLGFDSMPPKFWSYSKLKKDSINGSVCHASAANMFTPNDFRMILCAEISAQDFYIIHHEMGHIQYYMNYQHQPSIYQDGSNSAFHEAIGDAIVYGVKTPTHLQRLGLIRDVEESSGIDIRLLLEQALTKLPEIAFALAVEKWRWGVFAGEIAPHEYNEAWWLLRGKYQGLRPPVPRSEDDFDPGAKFHIADNIPYARYFLSSIVQIQIFEALCKGSVYGDGGLHKTLEMPLHRCDIYGAKDGSRRLRDIMSRGSSVHWSDALEMITGDGKYSVAPLLSYYRPLYSWLLAEIRKYDIPVGW